MKKIKFKNKQQVNDNRLILQKTFSEILKEAEKKSEASPNDVCNEVGISSATYTRLKKGENAIDTYNFIMLCAYFKIDISSILDIWWKAEEDTDVMDFIKRFIKMSKNDREIFERVMLPFMEKYYPTTDNTGKHNDSDQAFKENKASDS